MNTRKLINYLSHRYPRSGSTFLGDFFGLQIGKLPQEISSVVVGLDLSDELIDLALAHQCQFIIVHHPTLFPKKAIALKDPQILALYNRANSHHLCVYSFHTNFDAAPRGMNVALLSLLGASHIRKVSPTTTSYRMDLDQPRSLNEVAQWIATSWNVPFVQLYPADGAPSLIRSVAVCAGSGTLEWVDARQAGVDLFISGDSRHHQRVAMQRGHQHYLEVHHEVEKIFIPVMAQVIRQYDSQILVYEGEATPYPTLILRTPD